MSTVLRCEQRKHGSPADTLTFESKLDLVLVPVVVTDRLGVPVGDLSKRDFQVFDNNKAQVITGFMVATNPAMHSAKPGVMQHVPPPASPPRRFLIFLFDDLHLSPADLEQSRQAAKRVLLSLDSTEMAAIVSLSRIVNSGLTVDRTALLDAMAKIQPQLLYRKTGVDCPDMDYYQAELIANEHSAVALQAATEEVFNCYPSLTMQNVAERLAAATAERVFEMGEQDSRVSLASLRELVKRVAALPGLTTLILVSPGFLSVTARAKHEESQIIDDAALSNITINAIDARGLYTTEIDASDRGSGSTLTNHLKAEYRRASMPMGEDVMAELALGTGGKYVHNTNDLEGGLKGLTSAPEYLYLLEFHARDLKRNSYHRLKVKVDRDGMRVQARQGYFVADVAKAKRQEHP